MGTVPSGRLYFPTVVTRMVMSLRSCSILVDYLSITATQKYPIIPENGPTEKRGIISPGYEESPLNALILSI